MSEELLNAEDRRQIEANGIPVAEAVRQLSLYSRPPIHTRLVRPCTPGDGILVFEGAEAERLRAVYADAAKRCKPMKLVPASGAASRMFKAPLQWLACEQPISRARLRKDASAGDKRSAELEELLAGLPELALWKDVVDALRRDAIDPADALEGNDVRVVLRYLLTDRGAGLAEWPK